MKKMMSLPPKIRFLPWTMLIVIILTNAGCHHNVNGDDTAQTYGLGDHKISADGKVELAKEYRKAEDTELQDYAPKDSKGCKVGKQDNF
jgi:hypothetical protein